MIILSLVVSTVSSCGLLTLPKTSRCEWCVFCLSRGDECLDKCEITGNATIRIQIDHKIPQIYEKSFSEVNDCLVRESFVFGFPDDMELKVVKSEKTTLIVFGDEIDETFYNFRSFPNKLTPRDFFQHARQDFHEKQVSLENIEIYPFLSPNERKRFTKNVQQ